VTDEGRDLASIPTALRPGEHNMEINCPKCGSNVAQILMGTGDSHYVMCLGCREITPIQPPQTPALPPLNGERVR
jgi:hypothetical protein